MFFVEERGLTNNKQAAGTNSLIKVLLMMRKNAIPPHVGIKGRINHTFPPLDKINVCIDRELTAFKAQARGDGKRRFLLNNFNATVRIFEKFTLTVADLILSN